mgnify:CR=1 FL=1
MLKTKTTSQEMDFYGKTNRGEFAWFVIFMGCLGMGALIVILYGIVAEESNRNLLLSSPKTFLITLGALQILIIPTTFILYVGFLFRWEYVNNGKNAIERFWRRYRKGILPKVYNIHLHTEEGRYYVVFRFYEGPYTWHVGIQVLIPEETFNKIMSIFSEKDYKVEQKDDKIKVTFSNGEQMELVGEEVEAYHFIHRVFSTQGDRIEKMYLLQQKLEKGEINVYDYVKEMWK